MKFRKVDVYSDGAARQKVKLVYQLQLNIGPGWRTVKSFSQTDTASGTDPADFVARKLYYNGQAGDELPGVVIIKWFRAGSVVGMVRLRLEHYSVKWDPGIGEPHYQFVDACDGSND